MNNDKKTTGFRASAALAALLGMAGSASATLYIYEPFAYDTTAGVNNDASLGDGDQPGGLGLGTWTQNNTGSNEIDVRDGGITFTDGGGNVLPVAGNAMERAVRVGQAAINSPVDSLAVAGLTADNSTIWMTFLYQDRGFSGPDFGIGLHSENMLGNDSQSLAAAGFGVGFGINSTGGQNRNIGTVVYNNGTNPTIVPEASPTFNGPGASDVLLLAMRVDWNPEGTPDEIRVFNITDLTTEPALGDALAVDTFDFTQAQQDGLDIFNIGETQVSNVDEVRVATSFAEAVGVPEPSSLLLLGLAGFGLLGRRR
jgi:hypothetical protein